MKQITDNLWLIEDGLYAERRNGDWWTTNEQSEILSGPFDSLRELENLHPDDTQSPAVDDDLMTLRQASMRLPVSHQALYAARARGSLPEPRRVIPSMSTKAGTVELYSLAELRVIYEKSISERIADGARRGWAKLTPEQRAERYAKGRNL